MDQRHNALEGCSMFGLSVKVLRIAGIDIKIDISWAIIAIFIAWALAQGVFPQLYEGLTAFAYWWMAICAVIGLALSIVLHELAHSLVAKIFGLPLRSITLFIFGGVAELEEEPKTPLVEIVMAIAGPLASLALALIFSWLATGVSSGDQLSALGSVFEYLALINLVLAVFNMLPALPLDGGRVFRAVMWGVKGDFTEATRIASRLGVAIGTTIIGLGVVWMIIGQFPAGLWWILIGLFIRSAAASVVQQEQMLRLFRGAPVKKFMTPDPVSVRPDISLRTFVDEFVYVYHHDFFPVSQGTQLLGVIGLKETQGVETSKWETVSVGEVMTPISDDLTIDVDADAMEALKKMHRGGRSRLIVTDQGQLAGVIVLKDLLELFALKMTLEGR